MRLCLLAAAAAFVAYVMAPSEAMARRYESSSAGSWERQKAKSHAKRAHRGHTSRRAHRSIKKSRRHARRGYRNHRTYQAYGGYQADDLSYGSYSRRRASGSNARPRKWCGWWMRQQKGGGPELNVAWNWRHWGRPSGPQIGAVVVWRHHVGEIVGRAANGQWIVRSGNDGGRVRTRPRSVAGAIFRMG